MDATDPPLKKRAARQSAQRVQLLVQKEFEMSHRRRKMKDEFNHVSSSPTDEENQIKKPKRRRVRNNSKEKVIKEISGELPAQSSEKIDGNMSDPVMQCDKVNNEDVNNEDLTRKQVILNTLETPEVLDPRTDISLPSIQQEQEAEEQQPLLTPTLNHHDLQQQQLQQHQQQLSLQQQPFIPFNDEKNNHISNDSCSETTNDRPESRTDNSLDGSILSYRIGEKIEVYDASGSWYPAKVIAIKEEENTVLVHFERWNPKFDQWFPMSSELIRPRSKSVDSSKNSNSRETFNLGDKVLARWTDNRRYPGTVVEIFPDGQCNVLFYDGYRKKVKSKYIEPLPENYEHSKIRASLVPPLLVKPESISIPQPGKPEPIAPLPAPVAPLVTTTLTHPKKEFVIEEDHNHFKCSAENCGKAFRKEKLLFSHLKHYHPELAPPSKRSRNRTSSSAPKPMEESAPKESTEPSIFSESISSHSPPIEVEHKSPVKPKKDKTKSSTPPTPISTLPATAVVTPPTPTPEIKEGNGPSLKLTIKTISNNKGFEKSKIYSVKQKEMPSSSDGILSPQIKQSPIPDTSSNSGIGSPMPLESPVPCEPSSTPSPLPPPSPSTTKIEQQQQTQQQPTVTKGRRGRRKRRNFSDSSQDSKNYLTETKPMKIRMIEKVSSLSPSVLFYEDTNPIPNPVLPFWDARTIRDIHESDEVDELVNCICDLRKESGLMVQCECCLTWQHSACLGIKSDKDLPEVYTCYICRNPRGVRETCRFRYDSGWLKNGLLPNFPGLEDSKINVNPILCKNKVLTPNLLLNAALEVVNIIHGLRHKIQILERKNVDLSLWNSSWTHHEPKIFAHRDLERDQEMNNNEFGALKGNENDMIGDILDFSKNILEAVPTDQDKNDVPDDLKNELQEGTDLIDFIASSYGELNGIKETEDPIQDVQPQEARSNNDEHREETLHTSDQQERLSPSADMNLSNNLDPSPATKEAEHNYNFTNTNQTAGGDDEDSQRTLLEKFDSEKQGTSEDKEQIESGLKSVSEDTETSEETEVDECNRSTEVSSTFGIGPGVTSDEDPLSICRQNLLDHILDVQNRLDKRLDFIESKICELEKEMGLDPNPSKVEEDAFAFNNMIKDLYKDLEIVQKISQCTR